MPEGHDLQSRIEETEREISKLQSKKRTFDEELLYLGTVDAVRDIVKIADNLSYLWKEDAPLHGKDLPFISYWAAQDDLERMWIERKEGKMHFVTELGDYSSPEEAAKIIIDMNYRNPLELIEHFKDALKGPLGKYLAERELSKIEGFLKPTNTKS